MELFLPEFGLSFWMLIAFLLVFFILAKYAWPVISNGIEARGKFIDDSIESAKEANARLAGIKEEGEQILAAAKAQQLEIVKSTATIKEQLIRDAKDQATIEANKVLENAKKDIQIEKDEAIRSVRRVVGELSLEIAEKVIRKKLEDRPVQMELIDRLLDESAGGEQLKN